MEQQETQQQPHHHHQLELPDNNSPKHQPISQQQQQQKQEHLLYQQQHNQLDVRMKRHPELQPYMPSDRFTGLGLVPAKTTGAFGGSSNLSNRNLGRTNYLSSNQQPSSNKYNKTGFNQVRTTNNDTKTLHKQPKKFVSMSRLDQLAQPKKIVNSKNNNLKSTTNNSGNVPPSSLTSSNATSTTTSSLTSNRNYNYNTTSRSSNGGTTQVRRQSGPSLKATNKQQDVKPTSVSIKSPKEQTQSASKQQQQQARQQQTPRPISSRQMPRDSLKESTPIRSAETVSQSGDSSGSISPINLLNETMDRPPRIPNAEPALPSPPASAIKQQVHETSLADQLSEMSVNERLYQSATSELVPDSDNNSTNGINYDRNPDSLCRELEQDLIAKGLVSSVDLIDNTVDHKHDEDGDNEDNQTPTANDNTINTNNFRRQSAATISTSNDYNYHFENTPKLSKAEVEEQKRSRDEQEEEKRMKIVEEMREKARLEAEEREKRASLVESILSRLSQGP